jgi:PDZ domain-containing protein
MFILVHRSDNLAIYAPGGITEVKDLIEVDYDVDEIEGSISTTYIISFQKITMFQLIVSDLSKYNDYSVIPRSIIHYTDEESRQVSYLQKVGSVNDSIISAYHLAESMNDDIVFGDGYREVYLVYYKAAELTNYDSIGLGDRFVSMDGIDQTISEYNYYNILSQMDDEDYHTFRFENQEEDLYEVQLLKRDFENLFIGIKLYRLVEQDQIYPSYQENDSNIGGPSGGLLQALSIYNMLVEEDITKGYKIAGTGTIDHEGNVGSIGGIRQKIATAYINGVDIYFVPPTNTTNYWEAMTACEEFGIETEGWLIPVATLEEAISYLEGLDEND